VTYNYRHFRVKHHPMDELPGPLPGELAVDFEAAQLDGRPVRLSDFYGRILVLETGSLTCPHYVGNIAPMVSLAEEFPEAQFLVLYVREAHPGERIGPHTSLIDKLAMARRLTSEECENRLVLVDDLAGTAHRAYGAFPNMVYVIDPEGRVAHRSQWAHREIIERVLQELRRREPVANPESYGFNVDKRRLFSTLRRAGRRAVLDFLREIPRMAAFHLRHRSSQPY
jgi:peroxiredoxin